MPHRRHSVCFVTRYVYDEKASERFHMDVVQEVDDSRMTPARWVESQRRLNSIKDPLARKLIALHRECGSGNGECDDVEVGLEERAPSWGCETTALIAAHYGIEFPPGDDITP